MHIIAARQTYLHPSHHAVLAAHGVVHAPVGYLLLLCHLLQHPVQIGHHWIGLHLAIDACGHVAWSHKQDRGSWDARSQVAHLLAQCLHIAMDGGGVLRLRDHVAAKLQDDQAGVGRAIEIAQRSTVDAREDVA